MSLYLKNTKYLDWQTLEITAGHLQVEEGNTGEVTSIPQVPEQSTLPAGDRIIDCHDRLVTKSFG